MNLQVHDMKCNQNNCGGSVTEITSLNLQILIALESRTINNATLWVASLADFSANLNLKQQSKYT